MMNKNNSNTIWIGLSLLAVGLTIGLIMSSNGFGQANFVAIDKTQEEQVFDVDALEFVSVSADDDAVLGDPDASVTIVEFADFQCPYCSRFVADSLPLLIENYVDKGLVKLIYRDFPLPSHADSRTAAQAAECVGEKSDELYFKMHDMIFARAAEWSYVEGAEDVLIGMASELGVDITACMENGDMVDEVENDYVAGRGYGVSGTPTFFINGKKLVGAYPYEIIEAIIQSEL